MASDSGTEVLATLYTRETVLKLRALNNAEDHAFRLVSVKRKAARSDS